MKNSRGFGLIEVVIGGAIISAGILMAISSYSTYVHYALSNQYNVETAYLLEEGIEGVRFLREMSWSKNIATLSTTTVYYLSFSGTQWATSTTPQYVDSRFLRSFRIYDVKRNANDKISDNGTYDPLTKLVTVTVSFANRNATTTKQLSAYITDANNN